MTVQGRAGLPPLGSAELTVLGGPTLSLPPSPCGGDSGSKASQGVTCVDLMLLQERLVTS